MYRNLAAPDAAAPPLLFADAPSPLADAPTSAELLAANAALTQGAPECDEVLRVAFDSNAADALRFIVRLMHLGIDCQRIQSQFLAHWRDALAHCKVALVDTTTTTSITDADELALPPLLPTLAVRYPNDSSAPPAGRGGGQQLMVGSARYALTGAFRALCRTLRALHPASSVLEVPSVLYTGLYLHGTDASRRFFATRLISTQKTSDTTFWCETLLLLRQDGADSATTADIVALMYKDDLAATSSVSAHAAPILEAHRRDSVPVDIGSNRDALAAYMYYLVTCGQRVGRAHSPGGGSLNDTLLAFFSLFVSMVCGDDLSAYTIMCSRTASDDPNVPLGELVDSVQARELISIESAQPGLIEHLGRQAGVLRTVLLGTGSNELFNKLQNSSWAVSYTLHALSAAQDQYIADARYARLELRCVRAVQCAVDVLMLELCGNVHFGEFSELRTWLDAHWTLAQQAQFVAVRMPPSVRYHELLSTMRFYDARFSALQLGTYACYGCDMRGAYMVIHSATLAMLRHAMLLTNMHQSRKAKRIHNLPLYPLIGRAYFTRYTGESAARSLDVDSFMLMCFVETLAIMLRVKSVTGPTCAPSSSTHPAKVRNTGGGGGKPPSQAYTRVPSAASSGASAVRMVGLLSPTDECFGAYRWLHRLVDVLQHCEAAPAAATANQSLVGDLTALNVVRAFLQLGVRHTIGAATLRSLHADPRVAHAAPELAQLVDALLTPDLTLVQPLEPMRAESGRKRPSPSAAAATSAGARVPLVFTDALRIALCQRNERHPLLVAPTSVGMLWLFYELVLRNQMRTASGGADYALARTVLHDLRSDDPLTETRWQQTVSQPLTTILAHHPQSLSYYVREGWRAAPYTTDERFVSEDIAVREPCVALMDFVRQLEFRYNTGKLDTSKVCVVLPDGSEQFVADGAAEAVPSARRPEQEKEPRVCTASSALAFTYAEADESVVPFEEMFIVVQSPTIAKALHTEPRNAEARARQRAMNCSVDLVYRFAHRLQTVHEESAKYVRDSADYRVATNQQQQQQQHRGTSRFRRAAVPEHYRPQAPTPPRPYASLQSFFSARCHYEATLLHTPSVMDADHYFADAMARTSAVAPRTDMSLDSSM